MRFQRPDLFHNSFSSDLVPLNPPCGYFTCVLFYFLSSPSLPSFFISSNHIFIKLVSEIPDVGELMLASFPTAPKASIITLASWYGELLILLLPLFYLFSFFLLSFVFDLLLFLQLIYRWLGEKYDGLRCCWNPKNHTMYPLFFFALLPLFLKSYYFLNNI